MKRKRITLFLDENTYKKLEEIRRDYGYPKVASLIRAMLTGRETFKAVGKRLFNLKEGR